MPLQAIKATALPLQINPALWLTLFFTFRIITSKPSRAKPEPSFLFTQPGMFNSSGQLLGYVLYVVTVSITQVPAHPPICKWCPTASLPDRSQQLWLQGEERESSKQKKKKKIIALWETTEP